MTQKNKSENKFDENSRDLVITRIQSQMSPNLKLSIGSSGSLNREEMVEHVKKGDRVGKQIINVHLNFIKAQASGQLVSALNSV